MSDIASEPKIGHNSQPEFFCATYERDTEDSSACGIVVGSTIDDIRGGLDGENSASLPNRPKLNVTTSSKDSGLELDLAKFFDSLKKYYELANVAETIGGAYLRFYFHNNIKGFVEANLAQADTHNNIAIYGLDRSFRETLDRRADKWADIQAGVVALPSSILLGLVASYDSLFSQLFSQLLLLRPERYTNSERQLTVSEILRLTSFDDVISKVIDDEVYSIFTKTHVEQVQIFEKSFAISVKEHFTKWPDFVEIFERRNLAAHGDLLVDQRYLDTCKANGLDTSKVQVGSFLNVDHDYLVSSIDVLVNLGTRLVFAAWHKQLASDRETAYNAVVNITFEFIKAGRFELADSVAQYILDRYSKSGPDSSLKAIIINRGIALKKLDKVDECIKFFKLTDWTAVSPIYNLCVASVSEDFETAIKLLPVVKAMNEIGPVEIRTWPAFDWIRSNKEFANVFERVFDEALAQASAVESDPQDRSEETSN